MQNLNISCEIKKEFGLSSDHAQNVVDLLEKNTIPFIARYRRTQTGDLDPTALRKIEQKIEELSALKESVGKLQRQLEGKKLLTKELNATLVTVRTKDEFDTIAAPFRTKTKTLAQRAKELGFGPLAESIIAGRVVMIESLVNPNKDGWKTQHQIETSLIQIIADTIRCHSKVLDFIRTTVTNPRQIKLTSKKKQKPSTTSTKYDTYSDFSCYVDQVKTYQTLAINRGEKEGCLTVNVSLGDSIRHNFIRVSCCCFHVASSHKPLFDKAVSEAFTRFVSAAIERSIRSSLKRAAESSAIDCFADNLRQLLLSPPIKGKVVLGADPGFSHGCKCAVVSIQGCVHASWW